MSNYNHDNGRNKLSALEQKLKQTEKEFEDIAELARIIEKLGEQILGIRDNGGCF